MSAEALGKSDIKGEIDNFLSQKNWFPWGDLMEFVVKIHHDIARVPSPEEREELELYLAQRFDGYF